MDIYTVVGVMLYTCLVVLIMFGSDILNSYLFPTLCVGEDYSIKIGTEDASSLVAALIVTIIVVAFSWWLIVIVDTCAEFSRYHKRKWLM